MSEFGNALEKHLVYIALLRDGRGGRGKLYSKSVIPRLRGGHLQRSECEDET